MATIKDVARRAGVGVSTVSRVLNNSGYFNAETARAVQEAVRVLGYRRNIHWSRLARKSSETICYLLGNRAAMNSMHMRMLIACEQTLRDQGYDLVFSSYHYDAGAKAGQLVLPRMLSHKGTIDGVILAGVHYGNLLDTLDGLELPYVLLGNNFQGAASYLKKQCVTYDENSGVYAAVGYLARLGHRRIAFVGDVSVPWVSRRYQGYLEALGERRLKAIGASEPWPVSLLEYGQLAAAQLLRASPAPTAIFAANDEIAAGVWKELMRRGISIPRDISLIGFGDREEFTILEPALTSVAVFPQQLGAITATMLLEMLRNPASRPAAKTFPCKLVERASCAPPPASHK